MSDGFTTLNYSHSTKPLQIISSESPIKTEEIIAFDIAEILCETRVKLIRDDYELKSLKDEINL